MSSTSLPDIARLFLRLGTTAFGGPAAHVAMMEDEVVVRRGWMPRERFLDYLGATSLIPGPNSTELALYVGHERRGWRGLLVAGASFILPAACIVGALAWVYVRWGALPRVSGILRGVEPVVVTIVAQAAWRLARSAITSRPLAALAALCVAASLAGVHELAVLGAAAALCIGLRLAARPALPEPPPSEPPPRAGMLLLPGAAGATAAVAAPSVAGLFGIFLKIGSVLFGSGYVLVAFLRADFVTRHGWLTERQLLDAIAIGQVTPGPVFTTATFVGYLLAGLPGAVAATVGIFLPAFILVAATGRVIPALRRSPVAAAALDGVNVASLALMAVAALHLATAAVTSVPTALIALASLALLLATRVNASWLVLAGAAAGVLL